MQSYGYPFEEHTVTTSDGYILPLYRIPHGLNDEYTQGRPAVLLQHGIIDPSDGFIIRGPELSPAFYMANSGYDIWVANSRGSLHGRNHTTLDWQTDPEFYEFSFTDMVLDHRVNIQYILDQTGLESISFFGFNSGGSSMYVALVQQSEWFTQRVNLFLSFGAIVRLDYMYGPLGVAFQNPLPFEIFRRFNINVFPPPAEYIRNTDSFV